jgi:DNA-binding transcriptional LysR family regulator
MHIETFKIFRDLAELLSFSKTAQRQHLSQSAVSQQLAKLELAFKSQLIDRRKRPFELTRAGELLYQASKDIVERYEKLSDAIRNLQQSVANRINIAAIFSIGMHSLPPYVKIFMTRYPHVNVHVEYLGSRQIHDMVMRGTVDIGLVAVPRKDRALEMYPFEDEALALVCSPEHKFCQNRSIDIHQLHLEKFVAFEEGIPTRNLIDGILLHYNVTVRRVMEFDNIETIKRAVEINAGISILPQIAVEQELANGTLRALPFSNESFVRPTGIIFRKGKLLSQPARYFIELLQKGK